MKALARFLTALAALCYSAEATPGNYASARWLGNAATAHQGGELKSLIEMKIEPGWHTYWINPGAGGMAPSLKMDSDSGYELRSLDFPAPKRFVTGQLPGLGYEDTMTMIATLSHKDQVPRSQALKARLSWLTCNDEACVPGAQDLELELLPDAEFQELYERALQSIPMPLPSAKLELQREGKEWFIALTLPPTAHFDLAQAEVFAATKNLFDAAARPVFQPDPLTARRWLARAEVSPYLPADTKEALAVTLVLAIQGQRPVEVHNVVEPSAKP